MTVLEKQVRINLVCDVIEILHTQNIPYEKYRAIKKIISEHDIPLVESIHIIFTQILISPYINDSGKRTIIDQIVLQFMNVVTKAEFIKIVQTGNPTSNEAVGMDHSLIRDAIRMDLPLTFGTLFFSSTWDDAFYIENRYEHHSHQEMMDLMRTKQRFCTDNENGYGIAGKLTTELITRDNATSWLTRFEWARLARRQLLNITPLSNLPSILKHGILSHDLASTIEHRDVSNQNVQSLRDKRILPNGQKLHSYANLYFDARNPMMYKLSHDVSKPPICVLEISPAILQLPAVIVSDRNAASNEANFMDATNIDDINFNAIFAEIWSERHLDTVSSIDANLDERFRKAAKCAEVLVPNKVEPRFILGAFVRHVQDKETLMSYGLREDQVYIKPKLFFKN